MKKRGKTILIIAVIAAIILIGVLYYFSPTGKAIENSITGNVVSLPVNTNAVTRILPSAYSQSQQMIVRLITTINLSDQPKAYGIIETPPAGWEITEAPRGCKIAGSNIECLLVPAIGLALQYKVTPNTAEGTFSGNWMTTDLVENTIQGDTITREGTGAIISVTPAELSLGQELTVQINPTASEVARYAYIYNGRTLKKTLAVCSSSTCSSPATIKYTIPTTWVLGTGYRVAVYDYGTGGNIQAGFTLR